MGSFLSFEIIEWLMNQDVTFRKFIIGQFLDTPKAPLSLHNIAITGAFHGRNIGEWHAPSITSRCISELINQHTSIGLCSYCALDMTVDILRVQKLLDGAKVLIWIPMRLGVDQLNAIYVEPIKRLFANPRSMGIAGYQRAPFPLVYTA